MDFGLVRKLDATVLTQEGKVVGTPRYFSPELIAGEPAAAASDLWSLGVTAYELLAGHPPFLGADLRALVNAITKSDPEPIEKVRPDVPPELAALLRRLMARRATERPTAAAARSALRGETAAHAAGAEAAGSPAAPVSRPARRTANTRIRSKPDAARPVSASSDARPARAWIAAAALACVVGGIALWRASFPTAPRVVPAVVPSVAAPADVDLVSEMSTALGHTGPDVPTGPALWTRITRACASPGRPLTATRQLADALKHSPDLRARAARELEAAAHPDALAPLWAQLAPRVAAMLADANAADHGDRLLRLIWTLDELDAVAQRLGLPVPFDAAKSLAPALQVEALGEAHGVPCPDARAVLLYPAPPNQGIVLYTAAEDPALGGAGISLLGEAVADADDAQFKDKERGSHLDLPAPAGAANGADLWFHISSVADQSYVAIAPGRGAVPLPVRRPHGARGGLFDHQWLHVRVCAALAARPGPWSLTHIRAYQDTPRPFVLIHRALAAPR